MTRPTNRSLSDENETSELGLYADDLHTIARRYERVDELEAIRAEALAQPLSFKLHSITGGAA